MAKMHKNRRRKEKSKRWIKNRARPSRLEGFPEDIVDMLLVDMGTTKAIRTLKKFKETGNV